MIASNKRIGKRTVRFENPLSIIGRASIVGKTESEGPFGKYFDRFIEDDLWGEDSWEKAETKLFYETVRLAVEKCGLSEKDIDFVLGGDLLNQLIATGFAARKMDIPLIGLYGACSTITEGLSVGAMIIDGGFADYLVCCATSHFSTAERQFRFPLEMGSQRTPTAQRTITGAGASVLASGGNGPYITHAALGKVIDYGIKDANNMGAAMAPAAAETLIAYLEDTKTTPEYYDAIFTGDLGILGKGIFEDLLNEKGINAKGILRDCGAEYFSKEQDAHMGGSGCGCCATVLNGMIVPAVEQGLYKRVLVMATGALLSTVSTMQGESIPCVAHLICIEGEKV